MSVSSRDVIATLKAHGFAVVRQKGSHVQLKNAAGVRVTVPHPTKDIPAGTLKSIERQAGVRFS